MAALRALWVVLTLPVLLVLALLLDLWRGRACR